MPSIKISAIEPAYAIPCGICREPIPVGNNPHISFAICNECRRAVLAIRKQYKIDNVKLPEEE